MKTLSTLLLSLSSLSSFASDDILNFKNNDTLHGSFKGFSDADHLRWVSNESTEDILFSTTQIRKVIFNKGLPAKPFTHTASLTLVNGDTIPCAVLSMDSEKITIQTDYVDEKDIARKWVRSCLLNPLGQQIIYQGPFSKDSWEVTAPTNIDKDSADSPSAPPQLSPWEFGNFSWYNRGTPGAISLKGIELPESFRIQFQSESARNSNIAFIFNADYNRPNAENGSKPSSSSTTAQITERFGACFALRINSSSTSLGYYSISADGKSNYSYLKPISGRSNYRNSRFSEASQLELRADFSKLVIAVYRDGQLVNQWSLRGLDAIPRGHGIGFNSMSSGEGYLTRLSNISIAPWNGVMDSALSLQDDASDILLLSNGKDRFSGAVQSITETELHLKGCYADMVIPRDEIQSITFAESTHAEPKEASRKSISLHLGKAGHISATPIGTSANGVIVKHSILGELNIDFAYLTAITYDTSTSILDQWNTRLK